MRISLHRTIPRGAAAVALSAFVLAAGQEAPAVARKRPRYFVIELQSLGGSVSEGRHVDNHGIVSGLSDTAGGARRATVWIGSLPHDLGTLGGPNSSVVFTDFPQRGPIVGIAETAQTDPRNEAFSCSEFFPGGRPGRTGLACRGFVTRHGMLKPLDTLGGTHSFAAGANNRGQVVGWAQTNVEDPTCVDDAFLQFLPVVWNAKSGKVVTTLPLMPGDSSGSAVGINDRGQIVGISGDCDQAVGRGSARHAVLWDKGRPIDLGNLGADTWNTPVSINQRGDIVGFAGVRDPDGVVRNFGAFLWTKAAGMRQLPNLGADTHSEAWAVNERRQVVGVSCGDVCTAMLWEHGNAIDLNTIVQSGYRGHLRTARHINDRGMITGQTVDPDTNERRAYLAIPLH